MTSRSVLLLDRLATLVLAVLAIAAGAAAIWWWSGQSPFADRIDVAAAVDLVAAQWWPWASAAVGVVLVLLGLRWIAAHLSNPRVSKMALRGSGGTGKLTMNVSKAASAAADALADTVGIRSASGYVDRDRGRLVAHIKATVERQADLTVVAARADEVSAQLAEVMGRDDLRCSVELSVPTRGRAVSRVG